MAYTPLKRDYQARSAMGGWKFCLRHSMSKHGQCPYHVGHAASQKRLLNDLLFEKWNKRPQRAYKLYWYLHPEEYAASQLYWKKDTNRG